MSDNLTIAVAQFSPVKGDIDQNINKHKILILQAANQQTDIIVFPELSLTGYEPSLADELALTPDDRRLMVLQHLSDRHSMMIIAGGPVKKSQSKPEIGAFVFRPHCAIETYSKMHLHANEVQFFATGGEMGLFTYKGQTIGLAICADIFTLSHVENMAKRGISLYLCSVLMSATGYRDGAERIRQAAIKNNMVAALANFSGPSGDWFPTGKCALWDQNGQLIAETKESGDAIIVATKTPDHWMAQLIEVE